MVLFLKPVYYWCPSWLNLFRLQYERHISRRLQEVHAALTTIGGVLYVEAGGFVATLVPSNLRSVLHL